ncbi:MAG: chitobiase/beta-hexosaminidase C-terminal domain-containing protein [Prevotella sp.]|nr:chitobiase/beta-hexosaminidase C-terminal domain-containing protein [Prevotella sp.]
MKKISTLLAFLLMISMSANAQKYRKTWDFRNGFSAATIAALQADMEQNGATGGTSHWRDYEKDASLTGGGQGAFWAADNGVPGNDDGFATTTVDGVTNVIPELEGLTLKGLKAKGFVIAYNYAQSANENSPNGMFPYGNSFIWFNGKNLTFKIKNVKKGETLKMGIESHKNSEARGLNIAVDGETLSPESGNNVPTYFEDVVWNIPDDTPDVDDYVDVSVTTTNGCHVYYIIVGEGDSPEDLNTNVALLLSSEGLPTENVAALTSMFSGENLKVTPIDVAGDISAVNSEYLQSFDVVAIAPNIAPDNAIVPIVKEAMPFVPMLNTNGNLYNAWGYGEAAVTENPFGIVNETKNDLFKNIELPEIEEGAAGIVFTNNAPITGVKLGEYFADDDILAASYGDPSITAIHTHNIYHNGYIYLPYSTEAFLDAYTPTAVPLVQNAISILAASKADITKVPAPTFELEYKNLNTNVTIKSVNPKAKIYYTLDGTEPTTESTLYTGPFNLTEETTVTAAAIAEGYKLSDPASIVVLMKRQAETPVINFTTENGKAEVTITCATPDAVIWYNYTESGDSTASSKYTGPITLTENKTVSAFALNDEFVLSEVASLPIYIKDAKVRIDPVAHMDANSEEYNEGSTSTKYYFSWGKNKGEYSYWDTNSEPIIETDADGNDNIVGYTELNPEETVDFGNGWKVVSRGHVMIWENIKPGKQYGVGSAYNPATVNDYSDLVTNYYINIGEWNTSYPRNGIIATTVKHAGPFDIVSFISNGNSGGSPKCVFEVSADSINWEQVGDTCVLAGQRLYTKFVRSYEGTDEVFVRTRIADGNSKAGYYDIYIMTEGENSKALEEQMNEDYKSHLTGVKEIAKSDEVATTSAIYDINGVRQNALRKGINIVKMSNGNVKKVLVK